MNPQETDLPLLPLVLDDVPRGLRQALAQEGVPCRDRRRDARDGRFVLFDSRSGRCRAPLPGQTVLDVNMLREGFDEDPLAALLDERGGRCQWQTGGFVLVENVARIDKRKVRRRVMARLRDLVEKAGGVWVRLAAYPFPYRSAFSFRIDYDEYHAEDFDATLDALAGHEHATSHFVNGAAYHETGEALARLRGLDVGSHGYWHHTYRTEAENLRNLRRGIEVLQAARMDPSGFVAPHGRYNRALAGAMEAWGIFHSSEFALAYDELPFLPPESSVLQIPIHPVCLGLFLEAARQSGSRAETGAVDAAIAYFEREIQARYLMGEPVFLYGHPTGRLGRHPRFLHQVFATVTRLGAIWQTHFTEFARWWRARADVRVSVTRRGDAFQVTVDQRPATYPVGLEYWRRRHMALLHLDKQVIRFSPEALVYENRASRTLSHPTRVDRSEGLRGRFRQWLDWEKVTPTDEIAPTDWRNRAKRFLRHHWK